MFFLFLALCWSWSGNQYTLVETPGYSQCLQQLRDVLGNQDTHTHLDFLLGSTVVSTAWCRFLGNRDTHATSFLDTAVLSTSSDVFPGNQYTQSTSVTPCMPLVRVYSSLTLSWLSQSVTVMCITLPDLCCVDHQRQDAQSIVLGVSGSVSLHTKAQPANEIHCS